MRTIGELINFGGCPVAVMLLVYPFGIYTILKMIGEWLIPIDEHVSSL